MRIVHLLNSGHLGGAETMCLNLCAGLRTQGHEVSLYSYELGAVGARAQSLEIPHQIGSKGDAGESRGRRWQRMALQLQEYVRSIRPDLVHSHLPLTNLLCQRTLPALRVPWVTTVHGSWRQFGYAPGTVGRPWLRPLLQVRHAIGDWWTTRSAARIIAISHYVAAELSAVGISREKITVVYNGLEAGLQPETSRAQARGQLNLGEHDLLVSAIGFLAPVKGFDILIEALARVVAQFPSARLIIVGRGVLGDDRVRHELESLIARSNLESHVRLEQDSNRMSTVLAASDIFCVPSRSEGFSLVLLQAMQWGLPSVVTSAGGCAEVARPGKEALVYASPESGKLATALAELMSRPDLRTQLGHAARERAAEFSMDRCVSAYTQVYSQVLGM